MDGEIGGSFVLRIKFMPYAWNKSPRALTKLLLVCERKRTCLLIESVSIPGNMQSHLELEMNLLVTPYIFILQLSLDQPLLNSSTCLSNQLPPNSLTSAQLVLIKR